MALIGPINGIYYLSDPYRIKRPRYPNLLTFALGPGSLKAFHPFLGNNTDGRRFTRHAQRPFFEIQISHASWAVPLAIVLILAITVIAQTCGPKLREVFKPHFCSMNVRNTDFSRLSNLYFHSFNFYFTS